MNLDDKIIDFYFNMDRNWKLPKGFELIDPFNNEETRKIFSTFYEKYFNDDKPRRFILGINPGRHGAGVTGIPFTDPKILNEKCGIVNTFPQKNELSAIFVYKIIDTYGGIKKFYKDFYINSVCPLGFIANNINCNYYDDNKLYKAVKNHIINGINQQIEMGMITDTAFCLGNGKNYKFLNNLNNEHHFFDKIVPLPHPRWVMQYRRKRIDEFVKMYMSAFDH